MPDRRRFKVSFDVLVPADLELEDSDIQDTIEHYVGASQPWLLQTNDTIMADEMEFEPIEVVEDSVSVAEETGDA